MSPAIGAGGPSLDVAKEVKRQWATTHLLRLWPGGGRGFGPSEEAGPLSEGSEANRPKQNVNCLGMIFGVWGAGQLIDLHVALSANSTEEGLRGFWNSHHRMY